MMEKHISDDRTGLKYELIRDYCFIADDNEPEKHPIGIWEQRNLQYLKQHLKDIFSMKIGLGGLLKKSRYNQLSVS